MGKDIELQDPLKQESFELAADLDFSLVETIIWESCCGFWLLTEHLERLKNSSRYFSIPYDQGRLEQQLDDCVLDLGRQPYLIRVMVDQKGEISVNSELSSEDRRPVTATLAKEYIDTDNIFLYHKTTHRQLYDSAVAGMTEYDEVLLWNNKGEVTESCTANILFQIEEKMYTPPVSCGLLPGTLRANLLAEGSILERPILTDQLGDCENIYLINSAIGWRAVEYSP